MGDGSAHEIVQFWLEPVVFARFSLHDPIVPDFDMFNSNVRSINRAGIGSSLDDAR